MTAPAEGPSAIVTRALGVLLPGFVGTTLPAELADLLERGLGGVCLFATNVGSPAQLRALTDDIVRRHARAIVAIDEEGGDVTRLHARDGAVDAGNAWLGHRDDLALTRAAGAAIAARLADAGCNLNFAPSVDVAADPRNPVIGVRSFGADPGLVARHGAAWVAAHEAAGVATCPKHFPGHGDTAQDSHLTLPTVDAPLDVLLARDVPPFRSVIDAGARALMTSHLLVPAIDAREPATFSSAILGDLLRDRLGFAGVVVSDALDMAGASAETGIPRAAVRALAAGCDLLCLGTATPVPLLHEIVGAVVDAVSDGRLPAARLTDAAARVARLGQELADQRRPASAAARSTPAPDLDDLAAGFDVSPAAAALLASAAGHPWRLVQLEARANIAAGPVPWGPGARVEVEHVGPDPASGATPQPDGRPVLVAGRDIGRHAWARAVVDLLRAGPAPCLVVEMGTPDPERRYADVVTHGGSAVLGAAVLRLVGLDPERVP